MVASLNLKVITPMEVFNVKDVEAIYAEGIEGYFTILPHHADYVASLAISVFAFRQSGKKVYFAIDGGALVKKGEQVELAIRHAIKGDNLNDLKRQMENEFYEIDENEKKTRTALASLEGNIARLILGLNE